MYQIKASTWRDGTLKLLQRKLGYRNEFPWNCGLYDGDRLWGDCWCMFPKTMVWSCAAGLPVWENYTVGEGRVRQVYGDGIAKSGLPDWTGDNIFWNYCNSISFNSMLKSMKPALLLIDSAHMGTYIGEYQMDGRTYNAAEFSPNGYINNTMRSYVAADGGRWNYKGGTLLGYWSRAGYFAGIDYTDSVEPTPVTPPAQRPYTIDNVAVHMMRGDFGNGDARKQKLKSMGYTDSEIQQAQDIVNKVYARNKRDELTTVIAMRLIAGAGGDGATKRRQWVKDEYKDDTLYDEAQKKINWYLE